MRATLNAWVRLAWQGKGCGYHQPHSDVRWMGRDIKTHFLGLVCAAAAAYLGLCGFSSSNSGAWYFSPTPSCWRDRRPDRDMKRWPFLSPDWEFSRIGGYRLHPQRCRPSSFFMAMRPAGPTSLRSATRFIGADGVRSWHLTGDIPEIPEALQKQA